MEFSIRPHVESHHSIHPLDFPFFTLPIGRACVRGSTGRGKPRCRMGMDSIHDNDDEKEDEDDDDEEEEDKHNTKQTNNNHDNNNVYPWQLPLRQYHIGGIGLCSADIVTNPKPQTPVTGRIRRPTRGGVLVQPVVSLLITLLESASMWGVGCGPAHTLCGTKQTIARNDSAANITPTRVVSLQSSPPTR